MPQFKTPLSVDGSITSTALIKSGGTSSQFLKADGSTSSSISASVIDISTTNFTKVLTSSETTAQLGFERLDSYLSSFSPQNGFENRTDSTLSFVDGTRVFTIAPAVTSFTFYSGGLRFVKSTNQTVTITATEGMWFFYFDGSGTLVATQTFSDSIITTYAFVASLYWDNSNSKNIFFGEERHGYEMDSQTHLYLHTTKGASIGYPQGFSLISIVADGSGNSDGDAQIGIAGGTLWDEDIKHTHSTVSSPASIPCFYLSGTGLWRRVNATSYPLIYGLPSGNLASWNQFSGGTWSLVQCSSLDFVLAHIFVTNDPSQPYISICGQARYTTILNARNGANSEIANLVLTGFPTKEILPVATLIFQTGSGYTNAPKSRIRTTDTGASYIDWRLTASIANVVSSGGVASWGTITGTLASQTDLNSALSGKQDLDGDLTAIAALAGTSGLLRKTAADTWTLDTSTFLTENQSITLSGDVSGSGTTAITSTLATVNSNVGTFGSATQSTSITVNGKGLITAISNVTVIPDQTGNSGKYLTTNGSAVSWGTVSGGSLSITNDTSTNSTHYPLFSTTSSGFLSGVDVSSTKLTFNPSSGTLSSTLFASLSDGSMKEHVKKLSGSLEKILKIEAVSFNWIDNGEDSLGVIAQQLEEICPEVIKIIGGKKMVNYNGLVALLISAVQELAKKEI